MTTPHARTAIRLDDLDAIAETLSAYADAARTGDGDGSRRIWTDDARVVGAIDGDPMNVGPDEFCALVSEIGPSPDLRHHVVQVEVSGDAAAARIEIEGWAGHRFTDFLVLHKGADGWQISSKVFDDHPAPAA